MNKLRSTVSVIHILNACSMNDVTMYILYPTAPRYW